MAKVGNGHDGSMFDVDWLWINAWAKSIWGISMQWPSPSLLVYSLVNRPEGGYDDEERAWRWIHFFVVSFRLKWILAKCARCCGRQWSRRWCHVASALFHWIMVTLAAGAQHTLKKIAFAVKTFSFWTIRWEQSFVRLIGFRYCLLRQGLSKILSLGLEKDR